MIGSYNHFFIDIFEDIRDTTKNNSYLHMRVKV